MKINFFKSYPSAPNIIKAKSSINGDVPLRAYQFCRPYLVANRMGWLVFPPVDFNLLSDGSSIYIQFEGSDNWIIVDKIMLPNFADYWVDNTPKNMHEIMPPFIEAFPERGVLQIWTGYFCETSDQESLWIRSPINSLKSSSYRIIEGIVETDWWAGMMFTNIEILKTDVPIPFKKDIPFLQVFSIPTSLLYGNSDESIDINDINSEQFLQFSNKMRETSEYRNSGTPASYKKKSREKEKNRQLISVIPKPL